MKTSQDRSEQSAGSSSGGPGHDGCPRCGEAIPLPLGNFCARCRYPLRVDSEARARLILRARRQ